MPVELMDAVAASLGLATSPGASIGALLNNIDETRAGRLSSQALTSQAEPDAELKVLDALARLCAPAKPGTVLATSMDLTDDTCTIRLAVNSPDDVPGEIITALKQLWTLLVDYSQRPHENNRNADNEFYAAMVRVCRTKMCTRIQRRFEPYRLFVNAFKAATVDRHQDLVKKLTDSLVYLKAFTQLTAQQERVAVIIAQTFAAQFDDVVREPYGPFQLFNAMFRAQNEGVHCYGLSSLFSRAR